MPDGPPLRTPASGTPPARPAATALATAALAPAAGLGLLSAWAGTFAGGASGAGAAATHALLLAAALAAFPAWRDPLALGRRGRFLLPALWLTAAASAWVSPVPRAGLVAVVLLPAFLLVPAAVARAWADPRARRAGLAGLGAVVLGISVWALAGWLAGRTPRAASPLGHHNLLAVWLLALLPPAVVPIRAPGAGRWLAAAAGLCGFAALAGTGSLSALVGAAVAAGALRVGAGTGRSRRGGMARPRRSGALAALLLGGVVLGAVLALALPRLRAILAGRDPSVGARAVYLEAGLAGAAERPVLGHGPGSTPWTIAEHLRPVPGINPPHEVVGDLHSAPVQLLYELGATGLLLALAVLGLFVVRRLRALPRAADPPLVGAALLGLAGSGAALLAQAPLAVPAVGAAVAVAAGAALAGEGAHWPRASRRGLPALAAIGYAAAAAAVLVPVDRAHLAWDRARLSSERTEGRRALAAAVHLDPSFPLYRAALASTVLDDPRAGPAGRRAAATEALRAAEGAFVGPLWLLAGRLAIAADEPWAAIALERACTLDPLDAAAPFLLVAAEPASPALPDRAARALLAEPRLAAATRWEGREEELTEAVRRVRRWPGIDPGWRRTFGRRVHGWRTDVAADLDELVLGIDLRGSESFSPAAFRRLPRPLEIAVAPVRAELARQVEVPPATLLRTSSPAAFGDRGCLGGAVP